MRTAKGIWVLLVLFRVAIISVDEAAIAAIKKMYAETATAIALARKGEEGGLYCNELTFNNHNGSWRAVGIFAKKIAFWYSDQPEFAAAAGKGAATVLAKVEVHETAAARSLYREFFFADGRLLFFFRSEKSSDGPVSEERIYFWNGKPLWQLPGSEKASGPMALQEISREAEYWQRLFLLSFGG